MPSAASLVPAGRRRRISGSGAPAVVASKDQVSWLAPPERRRSSATPVAPRRPRRTAAARPSASPRLRSPSARCGLRLPLCAPLALTLRSAPAARFAPGSLVHLPQELREAVADAPAAAPLG